MLFYILKRSFMISSVLLLTANSFAQDSTEEIESSNASVEVEAVVEKIVDSEVSEFAPYSVETETIELRARGMLRRTIEANEYSYSARQSTQRARIFGRTRQTIKISYAFAKADESLEMTGECTLRTEGTSIANYDFSNETLQPYACGVGEPEGNDVALEVALPAFAASGARFGGFSISMSSEDEIDQQGILCADMMFEGQAYQAMPTSFRSAGMMGARSVEGYTIMRGEELVGRIDFGRNSPTQGTVVVPVSEADGRQAVLYMALNLMEMPDLFAERVREEVLGR